MTFGQLLLYLMIGTPQERADLKAGWHSICEKHLIADDPEDKLRWERWKLRQEKAPDSEEQK